MIQHHNDLIRRLRNAAPPAIKGPNLLDEAADRIRELEAQVESLQNKWASRPLSSEDQARYIHELEVALDEISNCGYCDKCAQIAKGVIGSEAETSVAQAPI